ncbi:MAG: hypothetical protein BWZ00_00609 [Bacteroidetes bacterium ADurb.BinA174]|mgnify:FL=1|nr:MAG: hypothetical protein BWZ00_00609 [Bacteroidetes bacterium ADurb.BinA174]
MTDKLKKYETIGCCGIDCGLCPRFHTKGESGCPGCGGLNFKDKHPSCGFLTCCVIKNELEVCSDCNDYLCKRFDSEKSGYDSFVTHKKVFANLDYIKANGIENFINNQNVRIDILNYLLTNFDDGRSKNFYCISCALLPNNKLQEVSSFTKTLNDKIETKEKCIRIKNSLTEIADSLEIDLKLNKKK